MSDNIMRVAESSAAISDCVHSDKDLYQRLYDSCKDQVSGFPGIWKLCAECALEVEKQPYEEDDWIDLMFAIGAVIIDIPDRDNAVIKEPKRIVELAMKCLADQKERATR